MCFRLKFCKGRTAPIMCCDIPCNGVNYGSNQLRAGLFEHVQSGRPIYPMNYLLRSRCAFVWNYPSLDLKFVNNTDRTVFLSEIVINVEESKSIREPLFVIRRDPPTTARRRPYTRQRRLVGD